MRCFATIAANSPHRLKPTIPAIRSLSPDIEIGMLHWRKIKASTSTRNRHTIFTLPMRWMEEKILRESKKKEVNQLVRGDVLRLRRYYVQSILDIVIFLASNELVLRGNWDMDANAEDGLFQNLFKYTLKKDELLQKAVKLIPKNAKYTSPGIQNDLIKSDNQ